ncbi:MAG: hypothetical protein GX829_08860, partial [Clostridium sp.]|nr:hypothetical protein [Clostridium sp.]
MKTKKLTTATPKSRRTSILVRLLIVPLIVVILSVGAIGAISSLMTRSSLIDQMKLDGEFLLTQFVSTMENNHNSLEAMNYFVEDNIKNANKTMARDRDNLSNEKLKALAEDLHLDEVNYFSAEGVLLYSNIDTNPGWVMEEGHPLMEFSKGNETILMEEIRKDTVSDNYFKYGALKNPDGTMVQTGINADIINRLTDEFSFQTLVKELADADEIYYALFTNLEHQVEAHSEHERIGLDFSDNQGIISATNENIPSSSKTVYAFSDLPVYDNIYPVVINGETVGAVDMGFSMVNVNNAIRKNITTILLVGLLAIVLLVSILFYTSNYAVKIIRSLNGKLNDMASGDFTVDTDVLKTKNDEFGEIVQAVITMKLSIRNMIENVMAKSQTLAAHSEELSATTLESVKASEDVSHAIEGIARGASEQALNTENGFNTVRSLGVTVDNNGTLITQMSTLASKVNTLKNEGLDIVKELVEKTRVSRDDAQGVHDIIKDTSMSVDQIAISSGMIQNIASQTNLLAPNA